MNGFININKPTNITSSDVVVKVRRKLREITGEKNICVGHLGTLDPAAEGVLVIAVGTAARLFDYFLKKRKIYFAEFTFGESTDTLDKDGKIIVSGRLLPSLPALSDAAKKLTGEVFQVPPQYSAKSIGGVRAYELARRGKTVEIPAKKVVINDIKILSFDGKKVEVSVNCLGGVYIRSIARDMAEICGTAGYMSRLKRLSAGVFDIEDSVNLDSFLNGVNVSLLPLEYALADFARLDIDAKYLERIKNGVRITFADMPEGDFLVYIGGALFGVGRNEDGKLVLKVRF
ncbi:MAG: tRNA pseudouridine(55) synthase TruB [Clostridiales bacterium]|jgi:tRNA pseudouridine55 synthase|nr:tRNA pseudouridine(55) synthase TruB [Clostridiales bacterium]